MLDIASGGAAAKAVSPLRELWDKGYTHLHPIVPPAAKINSTSYLTKSSKGLGKIPGVRGPDGLWIGINWSHYRASEKELRKWEGWEAGVGLRLGPIDDDKPDGECLLAIDSDVYDTPLAKLVDDIIRHHFGELPCRIGMFPKAAYLVRVSRPLRYARVAFGEPDGHTGAQKHAVEILAGMRQIVLPPSIHPRTGKPYRWARPLVPLDALTITTPEKIAAFMADLENALPDASLANGHALSKADREQIDQEGLKGEISLVEEAIDALPNDSRFDDRGKWVNVGIMLRAATADDPDRGFELWDKWSAKWSGYDSHNTETTWHSFKGPFEKGAASLFRPRCAFPRAALLQPGYRGGERWPNQRSVGAQQHLGAGSQASIHCAGDRCR